MVNNQKKYLLLPKTNFQKNPFTKLFKNAEELILVVTNIMGSLQP
jgi:hypothetical protein